MRQRGPVLVERAGNRYRAVFAVRPVPILASGPIGQFFPLDYLYASIAAQQGDSWPSLDESSLPFITDYCGRGKT